MARTPLFAAALLVGCGSPLASEAVAELMVQHTYRTTRQPLGAVTLTTGVFGLAWTKQEYASGGEGPELMRAVAHRLARCGQATGDLLEVRISGSVGDWPWAVKVLESTPGAETCVANVLSQVPLDAGLWAGSRYLAVKTRVADLLAPRQEERDPPECRLEHDLSKRSTRGQPLQLRSIGEVALRVTCGSEVPLTELTLIYE